MTANAMPMASRMATTSKATRLLGFMDMLMNTGSNLKEASISVVQSDAIGLLIRKHFNLIYSILTGRREKVDSESPKGRGVATLMLTANPVTVEAICFLKRN